MNLKTLKLHNQRVVQILNWIEEDPSIEMLFTGDAEKSESNSKRVVKYHGFRATALRALSERTLSLSQLRGIVHQPRDIFLKNLRSLINPGLVQLEAKNIILTAKGKEEADYFVKNPEKSVRR
jgi:hypothetical protein